MAILLGMSAKEAATSVIKAWALPCIETWPLGNMAKSDLSMISMRKPSFSRVMDTCSLRFSSFLFSDSFCLSSFSSLSKLAWSASAAIFFFCSGVSLSGSAFSFSFSGPGSVSGLGPPSERGVKRSSSPVCLAE